MGGVLDLRESIVSLKADEKMIAFVGFMIRPDDRTPSKEGVLKIAEFYRPNASGYLTLTFIVDTQDDQTDKENLRQVFKKLNEAVLRTHLGSPLEALVNVPLNLMGAGQDWHLEEFSLYLKKMERANRLFIQKDLLCALESILCCTFQDVQWWDEDMAEKKKVQSAKEKQPTSSTNEPMSLLQRLFG